MTGGSPKPYGTKDNQQADLDPNDEDLVDPRDLVYTSRLAGDPGEILSNPAVTPQMPNNPGDLRSDLREEE
ncbi:MAG: hypothetical protein ACM37W_13730 [Actinomycetota bacterium]